MWTGTPFNALLTRPVTGVNLGAPRPCWGSICTPLKDRIAIGARTDGGDMDEDMPMWWPYEKP